MDMKIFSQSFEPDHIQHREEQINHIEGVFLKLKEFGTSANLLLSGRTGTGKTTCVDFVRHNYPKEHLYVSGVTNETPIKILRVLSDSNASTIEKMVSVLCENLKKEPKVIIIDELNKVSEIRYLFNLLNAVYRETNCPIIAITNRPRFLDSIDHDVKKTLFLERIQFNPYNAEQLKSIIKDRLDIINGDLKTEIPEDSLNYICALSATDGSARNVLSITSRCLIENNFSKEYIQLLEKRLEQEEWIEFVQSLKPNETKFLRAILELHASENPINNQSLQTFLKKSPSTISQLITTFVEKYGILGYNYQWGYGKNTRGRYRELFFVSNDTFAKLDGAVDQE